MFNQTDLKTTVLIHKVYGARRENEQAPASSGTTNSEGADPDLKWNQANTLLRDYRAHVI